MGKTLNKNELGKLAKILGTAVSGSKFQDHVYIVGGAVRDYFLGNEIKDIDIAVDLPNGGIEFGTFINNKFGFQHSIVTYPNYGTCKFTLTLPEIGEVDFEAVQCRKEWYTNGSRKPSSIAVGNIREDAHRRDLTINALYLDVNSLKVFDPTNSGYNDLKNHILRCPSEPNKTFNDDPLRMLRVVRFKTKYNWGIDKDTWIGILENAKEIETVSKERINDELTKILLCDTPSVGIRSLLYSNLLGYIIPEVYNLVGLTQGKQHFGDVFEHTMKCLDNTKKDIGCRLGGLLHDIGKLNTKTDYNGEIHFYCHEDVGARMIEPILKNLKFPNNVIAKVILLVKYHMKFKEIPDNKLPSDKSIRKFLNETHGFADDILDVMNADNISHKEEYNKPNFVKNLTERIKQIKENEADYSKKLVLPINGDDIKKEFKLKTSPIIGTLLKKVKEEFLNNPNMSKDDCFEIVEKELSTKC